MHGITITNAPWVLAQSEDGNWSRRHTSSSERVLVQWEARSLKTFLLQCKQWKTSCPAADCAVGQCIETS